MGDGFRKGSVVEFSGEELAGRSSWFRAVTHERWVCRLVWTTTSFRAEPVCEAERTHHPTLVSEELVKSDDLQFVLMPVIFLICAYEYRYSVFGSKRTVTTHSVSAQGGVYVPEYAYPVYGIF